uniref:RNA helicase n=1 Tax=Ditylenchus dipsaci TaxID=166011 RepID=A0A915DA26_9BILA
MSEEDEDTQRLVFSEVHDLEERTIDVASDTTFENLMIKPSIIADLLKSGYRKPSPVQAKAIPLGLLGMDMLVQAKTGTGKTLVFGVLSADHLLSAPSERGLHIKLCPRNFFHGLFVGGVDVEQDKNLLRKGCQVAVGTAGRLAHLVKHRALDTRKVSLFVLDEADKLMEESFKQEVNYLFSSLPPQATQVCVFSATYPRDLEQTLCNYMLEPTLIRLNVEDVQLLGIKQYAVVEENKPDVETLLDILHTVTYSQCLIFSNDQKRCVDVATYLNQHDIRATHFSSSLSQEERFKVLKDLKNFRIRVLVSSDLSARGIDAVHVNMIVNLECPYFVESYLHRIGRAGRYGKMGAAFTILSSSKEHFRFKLLVSGGHLNVKTLDLSRKYPTDLPLNTTYFQDVAPTFVSKIEPKDNYRVAADEVKTLLIPVNSLLIPIRTNVKQQTYSREEFVALNESVSCEKWAEYACEHLHSNQVEVLIELDRRKYKCENEQVNGNPTQKAVKNGKRRGSKQTEKNVKTESQQQTTVVAKKDSESREVKEKTPTKIHQDIEPNTESRKLDKNIVKSYIPYCQYVKESHKKFLVGSDQEVGKTPRLFARTNPQEYENYIERMRKVMDEDDRLLAALAGAACTEDEPTNTAKETMKTSELKEDSKEKEGIV